MRAPQPTRWKARRLRSMRSIRMRGKKVHPIATQMTNRATARINRGDMVHMTTTARQSFISLAARVAKNAAPRGYGVVGHSDKASCHGILAEAVPCEGTIVSSDEYRSYQGIEPQHATVNHAQHEWARDDDGDGVREVHCNSCEGAGTALRTGE